MTTLPTTTPIRLPRPAGATPLAAPYTQTPAQTSTMTGADAWRVVRTNLWWIMLVVVICAGIGYGLNWYLLRYHSSFTAVGFTQVNPATTVDLFHNQITGTDMGALAIDQKTQ